SMRRRKCLAVFLLGFHQQFKNFPSIFSGFFIGCTMRMTSTPLWKGDDVSAIFLRPLNDHAIFASFGHLSHPGCLAHANVYISLLIRLGVISIFATERNASPHARMHPLR